MDRQQDVIRRITAHIIEYRFWRHNQIIDERRELRAMALELKGLKAKAMTARANIGKLDAAYDAFNAKAGNHVSDVSFFSGVAKAILPKNFLSWTLAVRIRDHGEAILK